jgi:hypothetical protein
MPLQRSRSKSKSKDKKSSADDKKDKKVVKKSSVKTTSKDDKVSQIAKQSVVVNVGDVATKKKRGRPRMKKPAQTAPPPPRFVEPPQSGLVQQAPQQIYRPPPFPSQNLVQPQPQRDALAPRLPTSVSVRQTLDEAQSEARVQAQNQARIEAQRRLQQKSRSVGDVEPSQRLKKQQEARLKKLVPTDAPNVEPPPKVPPPKIDPLSGGASAEPNPLSGGASAEPISEDTAQKRIRILERIIQKADMRLAEKFVSRSAVKPSLTGNHPLEKFELVPPYQLEVIDQPPKSSQDVPFAESYAQALPVEKDPLTLVIKETQTQMKDRRLKELVSEFRTNFGTEPNQAEIADMNRVARDYAGYV